MMLRDDKIALRALEPTDIDRLYQWENDTELWRYGSTVAPYCRQQIWDYLRRYTADPYRDGELRLMIVAVDGGEPLGLVDLTHFDAINRRAQVGIMVDRSRQRSGVAHRALTLLAEYSRERLALHQLWAIVPADNAPSRALFDRAGYRTCGHLQSWLRVGRRYLDAYLLTRLLP